MNVPQWIAGCIEVEGRMAELYEIFAVRFGEEAAMFDTLRKEELSHVKSLGSVEVVEESSSASLGREAMILFRTLSAADQAIGKARTASIGLEEALRISLSLEEGIVEGFITSIPSSGLMGKEAFKVLADESTRHADILRAAMRRNGFLRDS